MSLTPEGFVQHAVKTSEIPEGIAKILASWMFEEGDDAKTNDVVERMTGRKPKTFREFAQESREIWL